ncbi:MAG: hypothetical protein V3V49_05105 [Candidatus Krumholzibacteria bacterium]
MSSKRVLGATLAGCAVLTLVWAMLALSGSALANPPDGNGNHNHGAGGGDVAATVTFRDADLDSIGSDFGGPYIDDVDRVTAEIAGNTGNFRLNVPKARGNKPVIRELFFDFSDCVDPAGCDAFYPGLGTGVIRTVGVDLRAMDVDENVYTPVIANGYYKPDPDINAPQYHFNPDRCPGSTLITVRRIAVDTWEIEAGPDGDGNDAVACVEEAVGGNKIVTLYKMRFQLTVTVDP